MKFKIFLTVAILFLAFSVSSQSNPEKMVNDEEGNIMLPNHKGLYEIVPYYDDYFTESLPKAKVKQYEMAFNEITATFLKHSLLNPPFGFDVHFNKRIEWWDKLVIPNDFPIDNDPILAANLEINLAPYYLINGKPVTDFHISSGFNIYLNSIYNIAGTPIMADIYSAPQIVDSFHGYPIYTTNREEVTIINLTDKPIFTPVSQEEFILTQIEYWKAKRGDSESNDSEFINEDEIKNQQRQDFEKAYQELLKYDKTAAQELKKQFEEAMSMAYGNTNDISTSGGNGFEHDQILKLQTELKSLSVYEKKRQAYYSANAFDLYGNNSGLLPESDKSNGDALVRINPDIIKSSTNLIQFITIQWHLMDTEYFDSPRLTTFRNEPGLITDNKLLTIYSDKTLWDEIIKKVNNLNYTP